MKTKNNVQKTILKTLAIVFSLVLISITVNAQVFWKAVLKNNSLNEIAMIMVSTKTETISANSGTDGKTLATYNTKETEEPLELESWMTSKNFFENESMENRQEREIPLELENWMVKDDFTTDNSTSNPKHFDIEAVHENLLELEAWMLANNW